MNQNDQVDATMDAVQRFNDAFNRHDLEGVLATLSEDCLHESSGPAPDGLRFMGKEALRKRWGELFSALLDLSFDVEEVVPAVDRCVVRWCMRFTGPDGAQQRRRGIDIFRVRDGKIVEKLTYVKG